MRAASRTLRRPTWLRSRNVIFSQALEYGVTLSVSPDGRILYQSGPDRVRVSHSAMQGSGGGFPTIATSGQLGSTSSRSARLRSSLESRLVHRMGLLGSTLFALTWKERVTPSLHSISALRALAHRTSDNDCSSWPTPMANDAKGSTHSYGNGDHDRVYLKLPGAALLASWPTPTARDIGPELTGFSAEIKNGARLNPDHSRWLMGLPRQWEDCAPTETRSLRRSPRSSSRP